MKPVAPPFLARQNYRRRRLGDAARILPLLGAVLMAAPLLVGGSGMTSGVGLWLFAVWAGLVLSAALLSRALGARVAPPPGEEAERG